MASEDGNFGLSTQPSEGRTPLRVCAGLTCQRLHTSTIVSHRSAATVGTCDSLFVRLGSNDGVDSAVVDAGLVRAANNKGQGLVPVRPLETILKIDPRSFVVRPRNLCAVNDFARLGTLRADGTCGIVAGVLEQHLCTGISVDYVNTGQALHNRGGARSLSASSNWGTRR